MNYDNLIGTTLGQYTIIERIGQGGMSSVYRAHQPSVDRYLAVKILSESLSADPNVLQRFEREARAIASLEHPHIVPLYDYGRDKDVIYLAIRYLDGGTLDDRFRAGQRPSLKEISRLLRQLAGALDYAHSRGVIHRDIKPSNIIFDQFGNPYILDFGIASLTHSVDDITGENVIGTIGYISPEQIMGERISPMVDQFALGVVAYELLTSHRPFEADAIVPTIMRVMHEPPVSMTTYRPDIPAALDDVLLRVLDKDPNKRYPTVTAFADAFEDAILGVKEADSGVWSKPITQTPHEITDQKFSTDLDLPRPAPSVPPLDTATAIPVVIDGKPIQPPSAAMPQPAASKSAPLNGIMVGLVIVAGIAVGIILLLSANNNGNLLPALIAIGVTISLLGFFLLRSRTAELSLPTSTLKPEIPVSTPPKPAIVDNPAPPPPPVTTAPRLRLDMLREGAMLKHYELRQRLDKGEKNRVYKAWDTHMERDVAIKVLNLGLMSGDSRRRRFEQEASILRKLHNPHIVPFFDYADEGELIYMVMPLLEGGTLKDRLDGKPMSPSQVVRIVREVAGALDYLHGKNVIHRDLKASNIMFDDQGNSFIVDFGIAKTQDEGMNLTSVGEVIGTPYYIAPEQWIGLPVTAYSDQYSLGVLVFQMLTGRLPFDTENTFAMLQKHVYEAPPTPSAIIPTLPQTLDTCLLKSLAKKPDDRYPSARAFAESLEKAFQSSAASGVSSGHVFISYSRADRDYARKLAEHIRQNGFVVWIDDNIDYGDQWFNEIEEAIDLSGAVVVIMSPASRESQWVKREILIAMDRKKPILPVLLKDKVFGILIDIQYADVQGDKMPGSDFYARLTKVTISSS